MRILALVTDAFGGHGGIAQANRDLLEALALADPMNQIVVLPRKAEQFVVGLPKNVSQERPVAGKLAYAIGALRSLFRGGPFDVILCGHLFMAPVACILAWIAKIPFWIHIYGIEAWDKPSCLIRLASQKAKIITVISRYTRQKFLSWANISPNTVRVLPVTVNERFRPGPMPVDLLKRYGLEAKKVLLTVGRLSVSERYKGHDRVISVLPRLIKKIPNLVYVIVGDGNDKTRLEFLANELRVSSYVLFVGRVNDVDLVNFYRMADLFVMPSTGEGFGIVFLEAAACGLPVIGGSKDGSADALLEGKIGRMIDPGNEEELLQAISEVLDLSKINIEKVRRFSKDNFHRQVKDLVRNVLMRHCERSEAISVPIKIASLPSAPRNDGGIGHVTS